MDPVQLMQIIRALLSFYAADRDERAIIADLSDEEIIKRSADTLARAEDANTAFIEQLKMGEPVLPHNNS